MTRIQLIAFFLTLGSASLFSQEFTIKFATVAPENTAWANVMKEYDAAIRKESGGRMGFKIYFGGTQGTELQSLRKIRIGQLSSAGVTGVAIGEVAPTVRILEAPFLVQDYSETDYLLKEFAATFEKAFEDGGYILLGMTDVGFVHVFTRNRIQKPDDLKSVKMWTWEGDPVAETSFNVLGVNPIPLSLDNVRTSLQTGLIDAYYTSPLAAISLQWHTQARFMIDVPLTNAVGAVLISKKYFESMPKDLQEILLRNGKMYMAKLTKSTREDNEKSLEILKKVGIIFLAAEEKDLRYYHEVGRRARRMLVGKLYSEEMLNRVERVLSEFRKTNKASQ